jgi:hypothetical protein
MNETTSTIGAEIVAHQATTKTAGVVGVGVHAEVAVHLLLPKVVRLVRTRIEKVGDDDHPEVAVTPGDRDLVVARKVDEETGTVDRDIAGRAPDLMIPETNLPNATGSLRKILFQPQKKQQIPLHLQQMVIQKQNPLLIGPLKRIVESMIAKRRRNATMTVKGSTNPPIRRRSAEASAPLKMIRKELMTKILVRERRVGVIITTIAIALGRAIESAVIILLLLMEKMKVAHPIAGKRAGKNLRERNAGEVRTIVKRQHQQCKFQRFEDMILGIQLCKPVLATIIFLMHCWTLESSFKWAKQGNINYRAAFIRVISTDLLLTL